MSTIPIVTSLNANKGDAEDSITIIGTGFADATAVTFGSAQAVVQTKSDTAITVTVPQVNKKLVWVTVTTPIGTSRSDKNSQFTYLPPSVVSLEPNQGHRG